MANVVYVNVSGTWKQASAYYVNVGGTWKTGSEFQANVSNVWKGGSGSSAGLPTRAQLVTLDYLDFALPTMGTIDAKASTNSQSLDVLDFALPLFGQDDGSSVSAATPPSGLVSGTYYPIFAIDAQAYTASPSNTADPELSFRRMLSFDTTNTTDLEGDETLSEIKTIVDTSGYACNSAFTGGGEYINGIKIMHYQSNFSTLEDQAEFTFTGTTFNIYDDVTNAATSASLGLPSAMGTIQTATINGTSVVTSGNSASDYVYVNGSTKAGSATGSDYWASDQADYCLLGVSDKTRSNFGGSSDSLDTTFATTNGLAFGISDSDGRPSSGQTPREGISRRSSYPSLLTNWQSKSSSGHSGNTTSGYFVVYGKVV